MFISLMQLMNRAQFLNTTCAPLLFGSAVVPVFFVVIVPLTSMNASLNSNKVNFYIEILDLI